MPFHLIRKKKKEKKVYCEVEGKQILVWGSVTWPNPQLCAQFISCREYGDTTTSVSSALQGLINQATKMREKREIHWLTRGIILYFATIGRKHMESPPERLDEAVSCFPLLTAKERLNFPGPVTITFHLEKSPLMGTGVFTLLWTELELRLADCRSHYMLCSWIRQHLHYILFDLYSNFLIHCLKKLPSNLVQS